MHRRRFWAIYLAVAGVGCETQNAEPIGQVDLDSGRVVLVLSSDYSTGTYGIFHLDTHETTVGIDVIHSDATGVNIEGIPHIINRYGADNIQILDTQLQTQLQFSVGNGLNPYDLAMVGPQVAYIALLGASYLPIFDMESGEQRGEIDLSPFDDGDGLPEVSAVERVGDRAFLALQRLDRRNGWVSVPPSTVAVVDILSDEVVDVDPQMPGLQGIPLIFNNPVGGLKVMPDGRLASIGAGDYFTTGDGGIEFIDPNPPYDREILIEEAQFGGTASDLATPDGENFYIVVNIPQDGGARTSLVKYNRSSDTLTPIYETDGFAIGDITITDDGLLLLCDRTLEAPGVRIFNTSNDVEITTEPINMGLPPSSLILFESGDGVE